ncbi:MAG: hypothetical protein WCC00_11700 [Candidatus Aminicenantales bacterium]
MKNLLKGRFSRIREINRKYAQPRVKMTRGVRVALFMLRLYLILLVGILIVKFISLVNK